MTLAKSTNDNKQHQGKNKPRSQQNKNYMSDLLELREIDLQKPFSTGLISSEWTETVVLKLSSPVRSTVSMAACSSCLTRLVRSSTLAFSSFTCSSKLLSWTNPSIWRKFDARGLSAIISFCLTTIVVCCNLFTEKYLRKCKNSSPDKKITSLENKISNEWNNNFLLGTLGGSFFLLYNYWYSGITIRFTFNKSLIQ